ncbi:MAG: UDP-N-acetylmuramoyl-L-alanyl-D-glutamate--2,6-diaminopimelate ligase [Firmicutes bacterium]|nr:UDP-N-acetylmuramoyl-L-alanyl-D-glutamate--2,6-diaminopimelate ligase [Bacillota bacterium]
MKIRDLTPLLLRHTMVGDGDVELTGITDDHRKVVPGDLFVAFRGVQHDGHQYASAAVAAGAAAVLVEAFIDGLDVPQVQVPSTRKVAALCAHAVYGFPAQRLGLIGVTGTNGKTTTTMLVERVLQEAGRDTGLIGTIAVRASRGPLRTTKMTTPTTPPAIELARILREMADLGTEYCVMETSSHALDQGRDAGLQYRVAVFTNLTQDHLDYHGTMEAYGHAKGRLFARLGNDFTPCADGGLPVAVVNADDAWGAVYAHETVHQSLTYGIDTPADVRASQLDIRPEGVRFTMNTFAGSSPVTLHMTGRFSVYNALAASATCLALGIALPVIVRALESTTGVPGRFEPVLAGQPYTILVDYSHTPDSLANALRTIREIASGRVITVVGCGGDRDRTKRPIMAGIAAQYSDLTVLTSDNPRTEDPEAILDDMEAGMPPEARDRYLRQVLRAEGIRAALAFAAQGDIVLIAGKGDETYQIIGHTYHDFDDRTVATEILQGLR